MSRAQSAISLGGSVSGSKKHTVPLSAAGDYLTQEDEYARLNAELEARTAILLQDAESVLRHNEELLAEGDNQDHGGDFPLNEAVEGMQYDDDVENKVAGFGDKYEYLPSEEEDKFDLGLEEQLTGIKTSVPEIKSTVNQRAKSAKGGEKMVCVLAILTFRRSKGETRSCQWLANYQRINYTLKFIVIDEMNVPSGRDFDPISDI